MKTHKSDYSDRVDAWLAEHGIRAEIAPDEQAAVKGFPGSSDDALWHDIYTARFERGSDGTKRVLSVPKFYQAAASSRSAISHATCNCGRGYVHSRGCPKDIQKAEAPSTYCILASITKGDPGTFADFCADYGYNIDSRKAEGVYFAVQDEWTRVRAFFSESELNELQEIAS